LEGTAVERGRVDSVPRVLPLLESVSESDSDDDTFDDDVVDEYDIVHSTDILKYAIIMHKAACPRHARHALRQ
jgi:hypothetical protein